MMTDDIPQWPGGHGKVREYGGKALTYQGEKGIKERERSWEEFWIPQFVEASQKHTRTGGKNRGKKEECWMETIS